MGKWNWNGSDTEEPDTAQPTGETKPEAVPVESTPTDPQPQGQLLGTSPTFSGSTLFLVPPFDPSKYLPAHAVTRNYPDEKPPAQPPVPLDPVLSPLDIKDTRIRAAHFIDRHIDQGHSMADEAKLLENLYMVTLETHNKSNLIDALLCHPGDEKLPISEQKWKNLACAISAPANAGVRFSTLCKRLHIPWKELMPYFLDYQRSMAMYEVMNKVPEIARQTVKAGLSRPAKCAECSGRRTVFDVMLDDNGDPVYKDGKVIREKITCPSCNGEGICESIPDKEARELSLNMAGMLPKDKGPVFALQQNFGVGLEDSVFEVGKILAGGNE